MFRIHDALGKDVEAAMPFLDHCQGAQIANIPSWQTTVRTLSIIKPNRDLRTRLSAACKGMTAKEYLDFNYFVELLEACLTLNPEKRIKAADALKHPFFTVNPIPIPH